MRAHLARAGFLVALVALVPLAAAHDQEDFV